MDKPVKHQGVDEGIAKGAWEEVQKMKSDDVNNPMATYFHGIPSTLRIMEEVKVNSFYGHIYNYVDKQ